MLGVEIEDGTYGLRAVIRAEWDPRFLDYIKGRGVVELLLNQGKGWRGGDLSFLTSMTELKALDILDLNIKDITPIHSLHSLLRLGVTTYCRTAVDFSAFPSLQSCSLEWRPGSSSLFDRTTLTDLFVNRYKGKQLTDFGRLRRLVSLGILNAPVVSLTGLIPLGETLRRLRLGNLRLLTSLEGVEHLLKLENLSIDTCRRISSVGEVGALSNLKVLNLNNLGDIESLRPLDSLRKLEHVVFYESTNILDGDLEPLARQSNLSQVSFQNRRHYSRRREELRGGFLRGSDVCS